MNNVTLIAGKLSNGSVCYWECNFDVNVNDVVLVNNRESYDVVKVVGIVLTASEFVKQFTNGAKLKSAIRVIELPKEEASDSD